MLEGIDYAFLLPYTVSRTNIEDQLHCILNLCVSLISPVLIKGFNYLFILHSPSSLVFFGQPVMITGMVVEMDIQVGRLGRMEAVDVAEALIVGGEETAVVVIMIGLIQAMVHPNGVHPQRIMKRVGVGSLVPKFKIHQAGKLFPVAGVLVGVALVVVAGAVTMEVVALVGEVVVVTAVVALGGIKVVMPVLSRVLVGHLAPRELLPLHRLGSGICFGSYLGGVYVHDGDERRKKLF